MVCGRGINDMPRGWIVENEWNKRVYRKWTSMLQRCYNKNFHKTKYGKTYIGCTVCERWLTLSNFVEDVPKIDGYDEERFINGELELDKDINSNGKNKCYIAEECTFVTRLDNQRQANKDRDNGYLHERQGENNPMYGKPGTMKGKFGSENPTSKRVAQYDKQTYELIKIWGGIREVERELGIDSGSISKCCKGKRKSAGGFIWKYVEE